MNLDQKYFKSQNETNNTAVEDRFIFSCYVAVGLFALSVFFEILGSQDIVLYLLENGADIDMFNNHHNTPFFLATESLQREICQVRNSDFTWLSISYDRFKERDREALWESHWTPDREVWAELWQGDCAVFMREMECKWVLVKYQGKKAKCLRRKGGGGGGTWQGLLSYLSLCDRETWMNCVRNRT